MAAGTFPSGSGSLVAVVTERFPSASRLSCLRPPALGLSCWGVSAQAGRILASRNKDAIRAEPALRHVDFSEVTSMQRRGRLLISGVLGLQGKKFPDFEGLEPSWRA